MHELKAWFTIEKIDDTTYAISEYGHWEETHCYLLIGRDRALLIDTGLGVDDIHATVQNFTDRPVTAVATHIHWDHIGGHRYFPDFYAHKAEAEWLAGRFPLPVQAVRRMASDRCTLPANFDIDAYEIFQGIPFRLLSDNDDIDLGGRCIHILHTPGHSPGHMCFWEPERGYLFTGDLVYKGTLYANYPSTDPEAYLSSLERISALPVKRVFPGHHSLDIRPEIIRRMSDALKQLRTEGKLWHGSGIHNHGDWTLQL